MEKEFVPYELAVKLKELGFNEPCLAGFIRDSDKFVLISENNGYIFLNRSMTDEVEGNISAPLWQQAFDWFRNKHNLYVNIFNDPINGMNFKFYYSITESGYINYYESCDDEIYFKTVIEARLACLEKLIQILEDDN